MDVPHEWYFYWFPSVDLFKIMQRYWMIPGVVGTRDQTGPMHLARSSRVLELSDGSTVVEEITSSEPPCVLRYRVSQLTNVFRFLVREAQAQFTYQPGPAGGMSVTWRYTYMAHNRAARLLLGLMWRFFGAVICAAPCGEPGRWRRLSGGLKHQDSLGSEPAERLAQVKEGQVAKPENVLEFGNPDQWRRWLEENHARAHEAWLVIYKRAYADQGLALGAAVEEALCFGWIDGQLSPRDERCYALRFSPRKPDSVWSVSNIRRVEQLRAAGKMTPAGMQAVLAAQENGAWEAARRREQVDVIPAALEVALRQHAGALEAYLSLPDSRKKQYIYWLQQAKRAETIQTRIARIVAEVLSAS